MAVGRACDVQLTHDLLQHAAFLHAGRVVGAGEFQWHDGVDGLVETDAKEIHVDGVAAHGIALSLLEDHGGGLGAVHAEVEYSTGAGKREAQLAGVRIEADGLAATAVDHARNPASATQAAGAREPSAGRW